MIYFICLKIIEIRMNLRQAILMRKLMLIPSWMRGGMFGCLSYI